MLLFFSCCFCPSYGILNFFFFFKYKFCVQFSWTNIVQIWLCTCFPSRKKVLNVSCLTNSIRFSKGWMRCHPSVVILVHLCSSFKKDKYLDSVFIYLKLLNVHFTGWIAQEGSQKMGSISTQWTCPRQHLEWEPMLLWENQRFRNSGRRIRSGKGLWIAILGYVLYVFWSGIFVYLEIKK